MTIQKQHPLLYDISNDFSSRMSHANTGDLVAVWEVSLSDGMHNVEFEHGTTTGKRVVRIDGKVTWHMPLFF